MKKTGGRATLGLKIGAVLVAAGGSVGLGNIWRFPYVLGEGGGAAFLIVYLGFILLLGLPIMIAELVMGRTTRSNVFGAFAKIEKHSGVMGYVAVATVTMLMGFYFVVSGWTLDYLSSSVTGALSSVAGAEGYMQLFDSIVSNPFRPIAFAMLCLLITHTVVALGVEKGIERFSKVLMPLLFLMLIALSVSSLMMPGRDAALHFLFAPDFSKLNSEVVLQAMGQAFFSLSLGVGAHITYGSYFSDKANLSSSAIQITVIDTVVALLAGVMIFPAVFSFPEISHAEGPSLVFVTLPAIFNSLPMSGLWSSLFFALLVIAAITSAISLHEVSTAFFVEEFKVKRVWGATITTLTSAILLCVTSLSLTGVEWGTIAGRTIFDWLDYVSANMMMPATALVTALIVGWRMSDQTLENQLTNGGTIRFRAVKVLRFLLRYVSPAILIFMILSNLQIF